MLGGVAFEITDNIPFLFFYFGAHSFSISYLPGPNLLFLWLIRLYVLNRSADLSFVNFDYEVCLCNFFLYSNS